MVEFDGKRRASCHPDFHMMRGIFPETFKNSPRSSVRFLTMDAQ
jgi:hypothetical protein